jgi:hypothetical protein
MTIQKKRTYMSKQRIDLTGPDGNAFVLLGLANNLGRQMKNSLMMLHGITPEEIQKEMMSGDYEHLVQTLDKYFGEFLILER